MAYTVDEALDAGIDRLIVILRRDKRGLREFLAHQPLASTFLFQDQPTGESDAIALAEHATGGEPLAIIYPDNIYLPAPGALAILCQAYQEQRTDVVALSTVDAATETKISNSGRVDVKSMRGDVFQIQAFLPKGPGHFRRRYALELRACGMMVAGPHLFEFIRRARPSVATDEFSDGPVRRMLLEERGVIGIRLPGRVFDIGTPAGYRDCLDRLARR
jgi:UTP--glucose-1-phosphate uridylyltransferase